MRPDSTNSCNTRQPCLSLSEYAQNISCYFMSNTVFHFLPGNHSVSETTWMIIQDVQNVSLIGSAEYATVQCSGKLSFSFRKVVSLHLSNIAFLSCGLEVRGDLKREIQGLASWLWVRFPEIHVALLFLECSSVVLENVRVMESYGYGLMGWNVMDAKLNCCQFHHNYWKEQDSNFNHTLPENELGGNAFFVYNKNRNILHIHKTSALLTILHSEFAFGRNTYPSHPLDKGTGLGVVIRSLTSDETHRITVSSCSMHNNTSSSDGANMYLHTWSNLGQLSIHVHINNCKFYGGNSSGDGGGFAFTGGVQSMTITNCEFHNNFARHGGGLFIHNTLSPSIHIRFGLPIADPSFHHVTIASTTFLNHRNDMLIPAQREYDCTVLYLEKVKNITIMNSTFSDNNCTCVAAKRSMLYLQGIVGFYRNRGHSGGAFAFHYSSDSPSMVLNPNTTVYIVNNTAVEYGGGIQAGDECTKGHYCFFQAGSLNYTRMDARVVMEGNRAGKAGDSIFGGCLNSCYLRTHSLHHKMLLIPKIFLSYFQIRTHGQTQSEIAAIPRKICFCENNISWVSVGYEYHCLSELSIAHFRGETFHIPAMIVGEYGYASSALARTVIVPHDSGELGQRQYIQELGKACENLTYSVRTSQESIILHLSVENLDMPLSIIKISFRPCPLGFKLSDNPPKCDCAPHLRKPGVKCSIDTQLIHRPALIWIGNYSDEVVVHTNCPFDYCKSKDNDISLHEQNEQCAFNRSGVLCGACQPGLSLALGTSRCMKCSNIYILLFIPFALAGVALIILMLKCNLTVSTGTLNGLIFYANIIRANHAVFFPLGKPDTISSFLSVFIAWLNLDLGVEVCLFQGMDASIRTWLQFVFPMYIWILVALMICVSRYSTTIARLSGSNTVSVLATLFLLAYAKLLRTLIGAISFTTLTDSGGKTSAVWLLDGNTPAMKGTHVALVVMSIVVLIAYVLPFTMLVLLAPWLQARSGYRLLRWVNKIKPLLDAYQGPYRDKFRCWTGLLLLVRIGLFAIFGGNALGDPRINLFAIIIVVVILLAFWLISGRVYKRLWMKLLESFFLVNLAIFAAATLFLKSLEGYSVVDQQAVLTSIMIGSAFVVFIGILVYHCYQELAKRDIYRHLYAKCVADRNWKRGICENVNSGEAISDGSTGATLQPPTVSVIAMDELREPLLTDN